MALVTIGILAIIVGFFLIARKRFIEGKNTLAEIITFGLTVLSFLAFLVFLSFHGGDFGTAIDSVESCYSPFGFDHLPTFLWYALLFLIAVFLTGRKLERLSPVLRSLALAVLTAGTALFLALAIHVLFHQTEDWDIYRGNDGTLGLIWFPLMMVYFGIRSIYKIVKAETEISMARTYQNPLLDKLNSFLSTKDRLPIGLVIMLFPFIIFSTFILILFGQQYDSVIKVFTETYLWTFSQHVPPPPLDHQGHYLCTVAAHGSPKTVKPKYIGVRGGRKIIVNRQLHIANAFEEIIEQNFPRIHVFVRKNYDRYGYNLSKKITTECRSNIVYLLMKPLEFFFLLFIYTFDTKPEVRIHRQYLRKEN